MTRATQVVRPARRTLPLTFERRIDVDVESVRARLASVDASPRRLRLEVEPWTADGRSTLLVLRPVGRVTATERYFRRGHAVLDGVVARVSGASS